MGALQSGSVEGRSPMRVEGGAEDVPLASVRIPDERDGTPWITMRLEPPTLETYLRRAFPAGALLPERQAFLLERIMADLPPQEPPTLLERARRAPRRLLEDALWRFDGWRSRHNLGPWED